MNNILQTAIEAAIEAGKEILEVYNDPKSDFEIERKADNSPLTIADKKSHEKIMQYLLLTQIPILSEEGKHMPYQERKEWDSLWIVDPLDGTKEFIKRNGEFTVNIALVKNGTPVLGVIYIPVSRTLYFGTENEGAFKIENIDDNSEISDIELLINKAERLPLEQPDTKGYVIVASRSHLSPETEEYIQKMQKQFGRITTISCGSSIKICRVAEGTADVYPRFAPTMEWDTAAGHAIAIAAGKDIYNIDEKTPLKYNKEDLLNPWFIVK